MNKTGEDKCSEKEWSKATYVQKHLGCVSTEYQAWSHGSEKNKV